MEEILGFFPGLTPQQREQFESLRALYGEANERVNVISRKDIDNLYINHVLHSLCIARFITPVSGTEVCDLGCGGGFPGIPLAIVWPQCRFHLIDRIGKKVQVARSVAEAIGLDNCTFQHGDSGECRRKFDYVVSRAVMSLPDLVKASAHLVGTKDRNKLPNGLICLKGGDLREEISQTKRQVVEVPLDTLMPGVEYFQTKELLFVEI